MLRPLLRPLLLLIACIALAGQDLESRCGAYRMEDQRLILVTPSGALLRATDAREGSSRRLFPTGPHCFESGDGWATHRPVTLRARFQGLKLHWELGGQVLEGERLALRVEALAFQRQGLRILGQLYLPLGPGPHPVAVLHQGSERWSGKDHNLLGYLLAAQGVAAYCYDKRGVGGSQGRFTMDFTVLAEDLAAAVDALARHPSLDPARIGVAGFSQGGWIAPLGARLRPGVGFSMSVYGLAEGPDAEDLNESLDHLRARGHATHEAEARAFCERALAVLRSGLKEGWKPLRQMRSRVNKEPWFRELAKAPTVLGAFAKYPGWLLRLVGRRYLPPDLPWAYDPLPVLRELSCPQIWLIAREDREAPPEETLRRLEVLRGEGRPIRLRVFPGADHGMVVYRQQGLERTVTAYHPDYLRVLVEEMQRAWGLAPPRRAASEE